MPGDLILYSSNGNPYSAYHVTMYIGGGKMIEAPQSGEYVHITWIPPPAAEPKIDSFV
jgi:cell wall-associated NlpC family hydrolase